MNLKEQHQKTGKSITEMAKLSGITRPTYRKIINGEPNIMLENLNKVKAALEKALSPKKRKTTFNLL